MARPVPWNESFDSAFLGTVTETDVLASVVLVVLSVLATSANTKWLPKKCIGMTMMKSCLRRSICGLVGASIALQGLCRDRGGCPEVDLRENVRNFWPGPAGNLRRACS